MAGRQPQKEFLMESNQQNISKSKIIVRTENSY